MGALAAHGQVAPVAQPPIAAEIDQTLDVPRDVAPEILWLASISRRMRVTSSSVSSSVFRAGSTSAAAQMLDAKLRPMP